MCTRGGSSGTPCLESVVSQLNRARLSTYRHNDPWVHVLHSLLMAPSPARGAMETILDNASPRMSETLSSGDDPSAHVRDSANPSETQEPGASKRWRTAGRSVVLSLSVSGNFQTLRDMCGVNEIEIHELKTMRQLGQGAFGVVEQCMFTPGSGAKPQVVAVKKLKPNIVTKPEDMAAFMSEVSVLRKLRHNYIMDYIGIGSVEKGTPAKQQSSMFLVTEFMEGGTLKRLVMKQMATPHSVVYSYRDALRWLIQAADALAYMHTSNPMIIHRDLKLDNILLKGKEVATQEAKLADFGLVAFVNKKQQPLLQPALDNTMSNRKVEQLQKVWSSRSLSLMRQTASQKTRSDTASANSSGQGLRDSLKRLANTVLDQRHTDPALYSVNDSRSSVNASKLQLTGRTGTLMYMAPEMYKNEKYNEKVDVFSFSMVAYELLHKYMMVFAVSMKGTDEEIEQYAARVSQGWRPPIHSHFPLEVQSIISDMWAQDPNCRPCMREVVDRLTHIQDAALMDNMPDNQPGCGCTIS